jgi:hypothetical protein
MSWTLPIDETHTRVYAMVRTPKDADPQGLPGYGPDHLGWFDLSDEDHQRYPGDYEVQVGQGPITRHGEERLSSTDRGVSMVRRQFKEQVHRVADGRDPVGVTFEPGGAHQTVVAGNYIISAGTGGAFTTGGG